MTKQAWKIHARELRRTRLKDCKAFARSIARETAIAIEQMRELARQVARETESELRELREIDCFINSGKLSLYAFNRKKYGG